MKNKVLCLVAAVFAAFPVFAESEAEYSRSLNLTISTLPEAKLTFANSWTFPFLQGENALVKDNNIKFGINAEVTPVSMNLLGSAVLTPVAFLQFTAGGMIGSGWNIELFGGQIYGIGKNAPVPGDSDLTKRYTSSDGSPFGGTFTEGHFGGAFQFDMAAIFPGDWNHIVMRSYHHVSVRMYSEAGKEDPWFYENDYGENQNGWNYLGNYLLGYQMPIFLNTVALLAEVEKYLYDTPDPDSWGGSLGRWTFSLVTNFTIIKEKLSIAVITQLRTLRNYTNFNYKEYKDEKQQLFYRDRILDKGDSVYLDFYRAVVIVQYKLK